MGRLCGLVPDFSCGRSLYIDWSMVVAVGEYPTPCKRERNCPGGGNVLLSMMLSRFVLVRTMEYITENGTDDLITCVIKCYRFCLHCVLLIEVKNVTCCRREAVRCFVFVSN